MYSMSFRRPDRRRCLDGYERRLPLPVHWHLAYLQDRILIQQGKPQIYGTQHEVRDGKVVPMATREPDRVNEKRANLGLWSQAAHTAHLQRDYDMNQKNKELNAGQKNH